MILFLIFLYILFYYFENDNIFSFALFLEYKFLTGVLSINLKLSIFYQSAMQNSNSVEKNLKDFEALLEKCKLLLLFR